MADECPDSEARYLLACRTVSLFNQYFTIATATKTSRKNRDESSPRVAVTMKEYIAQQCLFGWARECN